MGVFQIHYSMVDGKSRWIAKIENTKMEYNFSMDEDGNSEQFVEEFARAMGEGPESVLESLGTCIDYYQSGIQIWQQQFFDAYFNNCGSLEFFNSESIFTGTDGSSLAEELEDAAEFLVEAMAA